MENTIETTFRVRYAETDQMGIVHHAAYIVWLEEGRSAWMRAQGTSYAQFEADGLRLAVSEVHVRYHRAAHYDEPVTIRCWVTDLKSRQLSFNYLVFGTDPAQPFLTGHTKHICLDTTGRVTTIPATWHTYLSQASAV